LKNINSSEILVNHFSENKGILAMVSLLITKRFIITEHDNRST